MSEPFKFPTHIRRKAEALELAAQLFPNIPPLRYDDTAEVRGRELCMLRYESEQRLREVFDWLYDEPGRMRIYKRPRWHFFYHLSRSITERLQEIDGQLSTLYDRKLQQKQ